MPFFGSPLKALEATRKITPEHQMVLAVVLVFAIIISLIWLLRRQ